MRRLLLWHVSSQRLEEGVRKVPGPRENGGGDGYGGREGGNGDNTGSRGEGGDENWAGGRSGEAGEAAQKACWAVTSQVVSERVRWVGEERSPTLARLARASAAEKAAR